MKVKNIILELSMKMLAAISISYFAVQIWEDYQYSRNLTSLILLCAEILTIGLVIIAKPTNSRDFNPIVCIVTTLATFYFFFITLDVQTNIQIIPSNIASGIMLCGIFWQVYAKIYLGRSFGLLPACRTIVDTGPYRLIRHPIYFGYFVTHMAFLFSNFSWTNVFAFVALYLLQALRIIYEERVLSKNEQYCEYKTRVKYRFIPFVF